VSSVGDLLALGAFRAGWSGVRRLPARTAYGLFDALADLAVARSGAGVARLRSNYARVRPDLDEDALDQLVRAGMRSYLRYYCDAFRLPDRSAEEILAAVRTVGDGPIRAAIKAGQPVVCFLGHMGNWDLAGAWGELALGHVVTVVERLKPEQVFAEFVAFRESLGMTILPLTGGGNVFAELRAHLTSPVIVPLLADRDLTERGIEVDLCGHQARMAAGPSALALATGAPLVPVTIHYEPHGRRHRTVVTFNDAVDVPTSGNTREKATAMTQACAHALGAAIREHTQDWHMLQRVFVADLGMAEGDG
jgi:lauroyl/myristoyl acyltransferase